MIKPRRVKLVWGASRVIRGKWYLGLFGLYDRTEGGHEDGLAISLRGLLLWGTTLAIVGYMGLMYALFSVWNRNPYSLLTYGDAFFYPLRRAQIAEKKGRAFVAQGQDLFRQKKWGDAALYLQLGLARCHDFRGRLTLAQFYLMSNQRPLALRTLQEGLTGDYPGRPYLETLFAVAEQGDDFAQVEQTAGRYLASSRAEISERERRWLAERQFAAAMAAGRHAEALAFAEKEPVGDMSSEHQALALLTLGRAEEAIGLLQAWRLRPAADPKVPVRLQVRAFREAKRFPEMEAALTELRALTPSEPAPLVYAVVQQAMAGRDREANAAFDDYLFRFGGNVENLVLLAQPLAEIGALALLQRVADAAAERGYAKQRFQMMLVQTHARRGEWGAATALLAKISPEPGRMTAANQAWQEWMAALLEAARSPAEPSQAAFVSLLRDRLWPVNVYRQSVEILLGAERLATARDVLAAARRVFPTSDWLQVKTAEVESQLAARQVVEAPAAPTVVQITEKAFGQRLEQLLASAQWDDASRHIQQAQAIRPAPVWLAAQEPAILLAQVRIARARNDPPALLKSARLYLNGDRARAEQMLAVARDLMTNGQSALAAAVTKEILRRIPNFAAAQRLLAETEAESEKKK
jgi:predicted Zn-dependent protease